MESAKNISIIKLNILLIFVYINIMNFNLYNRPTPKKDNSEQLYQLVQKMQYNNEIIKQNIPFILKGNYNSVIPLKVYMTWHTKKLPIKMYENLQKLKRDNPEFEFVLFDDDDCIEFIKQNFNPEILQTFHELVPGAYKADLWRLCILYKCGGFYLDIKENCLNGFKLIELSEQEHFVLDRPYRHILNALMVCAPKNPFLLKCIEQIVKNVKNKYYGEGCLWPTGPGLLGKVACENSFKLNIDLYLPQHGEFIVYKKVGIMKGYDGYVEERSNYQGTKHYGDLWAQRKIYS